RARIGGLPLVVLDGLRPGGPDAGVDGRLPRLLFRLVPLRRDPRVLRTALARALGRLTRSLLGGLCLSGLCLGVRLRVLLVREAVTAGLRRGSRRGTGLRDALGTGLRAALGTRVRERSEEHTSELQSRENLVCRHLLAKQKIDGDI